jgi:hypothetical protein
MPYARFGRLPDAAGHAIGAMQAARLVRALPRRPTVVVLFDALQWPLARGLLQRVPEAALWDARGGGGPEEGRAARMAEEVEHAAALTFAPGDPALWERLRALR